MNAYTVWVKNGKIGTYRTRQQAEQVKADVVRNIADFVRIQEWTPGAEYEQYVTFDGDHLEKGGAIG